LLKPQFDLASRNKRADRHAGRRLHHARRDSLCNTPALKQTNQFLAAGPRRITNAARGEYGVTSRRFSADIGSRRARSHRYRDTRTRQVDPAARHNAARFCQPLNHISRQHNNVERFGILNEASRNNATFRFDPHPASRTPLVGCAQLGQHITGGH